MFRAVIVNLLASEKEDAPAKRVVISAVIAVDANLERALARTGHPQEEVAQLRLVAQEVLETGEHQTLVLLKITNNA